MTREEANNKTKLIIREATARVKEIRKHAETEGKLMPGLDSNKALTKEVDDWALNELKKLESMVDE